jgi:hypothetical protein
LTDVGIFGAEQNLSIALAESMVENENDLSCVLRKIEGFVECCLKDCDTIVKKIQAKLKQYIGRVVAKNGNDYQACMSEVWRQCQSGVAVNESVLNLIVVKGGMIEVHEPLERALVRKNPDENPIKWGGQLLLDCRALDGPIYAILQVLQEIRDALIHKPYVENIERAIGESPVLLAEFVDENVPVKEPEVRLIEAKDERA